MLHMSKNIFIGAAVIAFLMAIYLWFTGQKDAGVFAGLWVPSILGLGALLRK